MNADRLLGHYHRIADAPDAIPRLRRFVLDLAVRGKLVPQDPKDEAVSVLLKRRKVPFAREGAFELPDAWAWVSVGAVAEARLGKMLDKSKNKGIPRRYLRNINVRWFDFDLSDLLEMRFEESELPEFELRSGDVLICEGGEPGRAAVWDERERHIYFQKAIHRVRFSEVVDAYYFVRALRESADDGRLAAYLTGTGIKHFTGRGLDSYLFPLPPLAEQQHIVAKVDELMALCDRLEAARAEREARRDRLAAASLARLNAPDPDPAAFTDHARFALNNLAALTTRPDQIKQLRQTILNLAVRGKLVSQDPKDEPASELLKRIAKEKARLVKEGKAKRQDALPEIDLDQAPFDLPDGWAWGRFPEVGTFGRGKSKHRPRNDPVLFDAGEHLMIQTSDVARSKGVIETYTSKYNDFGLSQSFKWPKGTLCITIAANIADSGILSFDACFPDSVVGFIPAPVFENARYFEYFVRTAKANLLEFAPATAQKNINLEILTQVLIPLPPLAEQHRIVAKVDELMARCDRLEASLTATAASHHRLLDAFLAEALAPADARELEAAE